MATIWTWALRYPALLFGVISIAGGFAATWDWSLATTGLLAGWAVSQAAGTLSRRSRVRRARRQARVELEHVVQGRFDRKRETGRVTDDDREAA